ncbi:MAG: LacI family DNA-binding transcriptional regulator [Sedimentisphaerales bacterium]
MSSVKRLSENNFMAVSIQQIASKVGVSKAAVSMALRNHPRISGARRSEIHKIAIEMGYEPNILARALSGGRTKTVGILWGLMSGPHSPTETAQNIAMRVQANGYIPSIVDTTYLDMVESTISEYANRQVDAVILQWPYSEPLGESLISRLKPFHATVIVAPREYPSRFDQVIQDRTSAMHEVATYLKKTGRSRPVVLIGFQSKADSYVKALREQGIEVARDLIVRKPAKSLDELFTVLGERIGMQQEKPDVVICNNDEEALVVMAWARDKGLRVPDDIAIIGFNDSRICKFMATPLASIAREDNKMVDAIEQMLCSRLKNPQQQQQKKVIPMRFIWRESAGSKVD